MTSYRISSPLKKVVRERRNRQRTPLALSPGIFDAKESLEHVFDEKPVSRNPLESWRRRLGLKWRLDALAMELYYGWTINLPGPERVEWLLRFLSARLTEDSFEAGNPARSFPPLSAPIHD